VKDRVKEKDERIEQAGDQITQIHIMNPNNPKDTSIGKLNPKNFGRYSKMEKLNEMLLNQMQIINPFNPKDCFTNSCGSIPKLEKFGESESAKLSERPCKREGWKN